MAGYLSPGAYFYAEEQEYLQAYEDVLERYKGITAGGSGLSFGQYSVIYCGVKCIKVMNFQYANGKCRKIGRKKLAGKDDKFILALLLAKGELEKPETARQGFLARGTDLSHTFGKSTLHD
ncbi:hypothetical protein AAES_11263 [Amazona aestiva]|uniref:Uncharacterized protein n=1 Tax=Amazona aestiva TaxID=12930 RepID=A0A0Q3X8U9_AMAAE|nr:hypothetical protein AAES_11263 [Amazona aestiva]